MQADSGTEQICYYNRNRKDTSFNSLVKTTLSERQQLQDQTDGDENIQVIDGSAKSQDFFLNNNATI